LAIAWKEWTLVTNETVAMNRMVCEDCRSVFYSAAARTLVEHGERCPSCGGRLLLEPEEGRGDRVGVTGERGSRRPGERKPPPDHSRRFTRGDRGDGPDDGAA
jgi:DNA-directed RNA polymerase subunit RPC12/RpoP